MTEPKPQGRPKEGRVKVTLYVTPATMHAVKRRVGGKSNTMGKVIDVAFTAPDDEKTQTPRS